MSTHTSSRHLNKLRPAQATTVSKVRHLKVKKLKKWPRSNKNDSRATDRYTVISTKRQSLPPAEEQALLLFMDNDLEESRNNYKPTSETNRKYEKNFFSIHPYSDAGKFLLLARLLITPAELKVFISVFSEPCSGRNCNLHILLQ
jgi:hypothetical protein